MKKRLPCKTKWLQLVALLTLVTLATLVISGWSSFAQKRPHARQLGRKTDSRALPIKAKRWALVIGVDQDYKDYFQPIPTVHTPASHAQRLGKFRHQRTKRQSQVLRTLRLEIHSIQNGKYTPKGVAFSVSIPKEPVLSSKYGAPQPARGTIVYKWQS